jgi:hypothetical protein
MLPGLLPGFRLILAASSPADLARSPSLCVKIVLLSFSQSLLLALVPMALAHPYHVKISAGKLLASQEAKPCPYRENLQLFCSLALSPQDLR